MAKIIASTKKNPWVDSWQVAGTSGHKYKVSRRADGTTFGCECKTWLYAPAPKPDCQHILKKKLELMQEEVLKAKKAYPIMAKPVYQPLNTKPGKIMVIKSEYGIDGALAEKHGLDLYLYNDLKDEVLKLYQIEKSKITPIKYVWNTLRHTVHSWGLVESKNLVEDIIANFPLTGTVQHVTVPKHHVRPEVEVEGRRFRGEDE